MEDAFWYAVFAIKEMLTICIVTEYPRIAARITEGEAKRNKRDNLENLLEQKIKSVNHPMQELELNYPTTKGKVYSEEEDRYLLCRLFHYGMQSDDVYERIKRDVTEFPVFRFDWFFKSRSPQELQRRCNTLLGMIEKEAEAKQQEEMKKGASKKVSIIYFSSIALNCVIETDTGRVALLNTSICICPCTTSQKEEDCIIVFILASLFVTLDNCIGPSIVLIPKEVLWENIFFCSSTDRRVSAFFDFWPKMLVLYETAMGYCLFKMTDSAKLKDADLLQEFSSPSKANKLCVLIVAADEYH